MTLSQIGSSICIVLASTTVACCEVHPKTLKSHRTPAMMGKCHHGPSPIKEGYVNIEDVARPDQGPV